MDTEGFLERSAILELLTWGHGPGSVEDRDDAEKANRSHYNGLRDPEGCEQLARCLAERLRRFDPAVVLIWQVPYDMVLACLVARELGTSAVRSFDRDGLVEYEGSFSGSGGVVLLADAFREAEPVRVMCALAAKEGFPVLAAGALASFAGAGSEELEAQRVPMIALVEL